MDWLYDLFPKIGDALSGWLAGFLPGWAVYLIMWLVGVVPILIFVLIMVMVVIMIERRGLATFQIRYGPNRAGPFGMLQPIADAIKVLTKEDIVPAQADRWLHWLAPVVTFGVTLLWFAVIPVGKDAILADLNIGILYVVAVASLGGMGVVMAGWACHNKYSLIGAMREISQMVSYEVPVVISILGVVMITGSLSMTQIVEAEGVPFILLQPLGFLIYFVAVLAQINRSPLDQVEAESELVSGFHTEYSGMKFALFYLGEYGNAFAASAIVTTLFLGGWKGPILPPYVWFVIKALIVMYVLVWFRATFPRVRIDQITGFAWKFLLPLALFNILITAIELAIWSEFPWWLLFVNIPVAGALIFLWSRLFTLQGGQRVEV